MWRLLFLLAHAAALRMPRPPPPGMYKVTSVPEVTVAVLGPTLACVRWRTGYARARYDPSADAFDLDAPLCRYATKAGVHVAAVDYDARTNSMAVTFDGRLRFTVRLDGDARNVAREGEEGR